MGGNPSFRVWGLGVVVEVQSLGFRGLGFRVLKPVIQAPTEFITSQRVMNKKSLSWLTGNPKGLQSGSSSCSTCGSLQKKMVKATSNEPA